MGFFDFFQPKFLSTKSLSTADEVKIKSDWQRVDELIKVGKPSALKEAVTKADKLLDFALSKLVDGQTLSERLKNAKAKFSPSVYDKVWQAHKVRNSLAHDVDYDPPHFITQEALSFFKEALIDLGVHLRSA